MTIETKFSALKVAVAADGVFVAAARMRVAADRWRYQHVVRHLALSDHEVRGGHTIARHVGKSEAAIYRYLTTPAPGSTNRFPHADSTFYNLQEATRYIKATLSDPANRAGLEAVMSGEMDRYTAQKSFSHVVGFGMRQREQPETVTIGKPRSYKFELYFVNVIIVRDIGMHHGFKILTAFPVS